MNKLPRARRAAVALALTAAFGAAQAVVTTATVTSFQHLASDASTGINRSIPNEWGGHQPRITRHADGSVRLLYLRMNAQTQQPGWRLIKRDIYGHWTDEAAGQSNDDVALLRDMNSDGVHVVAWPNGLPAVMSSPSFAAVAVPGGWTYRDAGSRQYGNAGIARDGTMCLKTSLELPVQPNTSSTQTNLACGQFYDGDWYWGAYGSVNSGPRHAYDYLFPDPDALGYGLYATSTSDLYKDASGTPLSSSNYVFNGTRLYAADPWSGAGYWQVDTNAPIASPAGATTAPTLRLRDSLIDSRGRVLSGYFAEDPYHAEVRGHYLHVANASGQTLFNAKWALPTYGATRLWEDSKGRLWLFWTAQGTRQTFVMLYPVVESVVSGRVSFSLGQPTDLSASFWPYSIRGSLFVTSPRGGSERSLIVDAEMAACWTLYQPSTDYKSANCYLDANGNQQGQRVLYVRVRLPD